MSAAIEEAIREDLGMGDITTDAVIEHGAQGRGDVLVKEDGIIAGLEVAEMVFRLVDDDVRFHALVTDGARVSKGTVAAKVHGSLHGILKGERTALNFMQRMSGIATLTGKFVEAIAGTRAKITDTRKTAPGLRMLEKYAVLAGGGVNHRFGLDDMVLIKDNHIAAAGGITAAVRRCLASRSQSSYPVKIEVETTNLEEVKEALLLEGLDRIMLDNFDLEEMRAAVKLIAGRMEIEASGNVSLATVRAIAETGVDFISVGALTHSPKALDISLDISSGNPTERIA